MRGGRRFLILGALLATSVPVQAQQVAAPASAAVAISATFQDMVYGSADAPITIIEYASLSCPHCARFHAEILPRLKARYIDNGQVRLILKDVPNNPPGLRAAMLSRCTGDARHSKLVDVLFKTQGQWLNNDYAINLARIGAMAGIGPAQAQACMSDRKLEDFIILRQQQASQRHQVSVTPTFILNDGAARVEEASEEKLFAALDKLGAKPAP